MNRYKKVIMLVVAGLFCGLIVSPMISMLSLIIPPFIIYFVCSFFCTFLFFYGNQIYGTGVNGGYVWGKVIGPSNKIKKMMKHGAVNIFIGSSLANTVFMKGLLEGLFTYGFGMVLIIFAGIGLGFFSYLMMGKRAMEALREENVAQCLEEIPMLADMDNHIAETVRFELQQNYIVMCSKEIKREFSESEWEVVALYYFEDYGLNNLSYEEATIVLKYFCEKYGKEFSYKTDMTHIPGNPPTKYVAYTTLGPIVIRGNDGTASQHIFNGYIFTRKD